jgi:hypothetical protein
MLLAAFLLAGMMQAASPAEAARTRAVPVTIEELAADPRRWNGRRVRVAGLVVRELHKSGLYHDYGDYCGAGSVPARRTAIRAEWPGEIADGYYPRRAVVEGTFVDWGDSYPFEDENGVMWSIREAGPGPLREVRLLRWTSGELPDCPD